MLKKQKMKTQSKILWTLILWWVFFSGFSLAACTPWVDPNCQWPVAPTTPTWPTPSWNWDLLGAVYSNANAVNKTGEEVLAWNENIFVRVSKFLLQAAVLIAVAIMIYGWVMYAWSQWDEAKTKKAVSIILYAVYWLILALASLIIVNLIQSWVRTTTEIWNT